MCGIFGFVSQNIHNHAEYRQFANSLFCESRIRGRDASGFAAVADGKFWTDKRDDSASTFSIQSKRWREMLYCDKVSLIGHTRAATNGTPKINENNHPFHGPRYSIAHNGGIVGFKYVAQERGFDLKTSCDSEIILHILESHENIRDGIIDVLAELDTMSMMAVCVLERSTGKIFLFRSDTNPCYIVRIPRLNLVAFASTDRILAASLTATFGWFNIASEAEFLFNKEEIPAYNIIEIDPSGKVSVEDINDEITKVSGTSHRGKISFAWGFSEEDIAAFSGTSKSSVTTQSTSSSQPNRTRPRPLKTASSSLSNSMADTQMIDTCSTCRMPVNFEVVSCDEGVNCPYLNGGCSGRVIPTDSDSDEEKTPDLIDLTSILPPTLQKSLVEDVIEGLESIRSPEEDMDLSDYSIQEYIRYHQMSADAKFSAWEDMTLKRLEEMGDGEYCAYFNLVNQVISDRMVPY